MYQLHRRSIKFSAAKLEVMSKIEKRPIYNFLAQKIGKEWKPWKWKLWLTSCFRPNSGVSGKSMGQYQLISYFHCPSPALFEPAHPPGQATITLSLARPLPHTPCQGVGEYSQICLSPTSDPSGKPCAWWSKSSRQRCLWPLHETSSNVQIQLKYLVVSAVHRI